jgi:hypothetical protein
VTECGSAEDRCPYSRDFREGFDVCPAFEPAMTSMTDSTGAALQPVLTCRHLALGTSASGRFYPRCALGGPRLIEWREEAAETG